MATKKTTKQRKQPSIGTTQWRAPRKRWSTTHKVAIVVCLITALSGITGSVFGNWDKLYKNGTIDSREEEHRVTVGGLRQTKAEQSLNQAEANVESGLQLSWQANELSSAVKEQNAQLAVRLKERLRTERSKAQEAYRVWTEAVKAKDHLRADTVQSDLSCRVLDLQRFVDNTLNSSDLKPFVKPIELRVGLEESLERRLKNPGCPDSNEK
jgi:hypothetical protein